MSTSPTINSARARQVNRAEVVDLNFIEFVQAHTGKSEHTPNLSDLLLGSDSLTALDFLELFDSQLISRHLDLMARVLRIKNKVFYTIGSSGHEGNAMVARLSRHTDPAFLHYRSGAFMAERSRKVPGIDPIKDSAYSFAASKDDPASGGRHKVWGSKALWVLPQTSTIASHPPKALGTALAIAQAKRSGLQLPIPDDSIAICTFGDASSNHSTAQGAFNAAQWTAHQRLPVPVLFVCEDNGIGISVKTPSGFVASGFSKRENLDYFYADGLDIQKGYDQVKAAVDHCRRTRRPTFLHMRTTRLMGHAGTDFEIEYRTVEDLLASEALDPLLKSADIALRFGLMTPAQLLIKYEELRHRCLSTTEWADTQPRLTTAAEVMATLAPYSPEKVNKEATRTNYQEKRLSVFGEAARLPEKLPPRHMALLINNALHDLFCKYPEAMLFGEDVAQKGGVYTITKGMYKAFKSHRVFNTLLDEQTILGIAQGYANLGMLPMPEIQYLAYFHNACDQIRGEAASLQFFSNGQFQNPMVVRVAGLGYQKGFGGHFHNDNSFAAIRDIPGLIVACPSRGDDAAMMLRTLMALSKVNGRVSIFLEPIALYMTKDLYQAGDGQWLFAYPAPKLAVEIGEPRIYQEKAKDLLIISYANGVPMSLRVAKQLEQKHKINVRVMDLRWLQPLNSAEIVRHAKACSRILIVDEGRRSASVGEGIITALVEGGQGGKPIARVVGEDSYTPLGAAANTILPTDESILKAATALLKAKAK